MGKTHRAKPKREPLFPFNLLMFWIKPYDEQGEGCSTCQEKAAYTVEFYVGPPRENSQAEVDAMWEACVSRQLRGVYTKNLTMYHCQDCAYRYLDLSSGENVATLSMMLAHVVGPRLSLALGCRLKHRHDAGENFVAHYYGSSIEGLTKQLRGNTFVNIRMK